MIDASRLTRQEAEDFLYHESRLLDEWRLEEWLALFAEDGRYWVPQNRDDLDTSREVSIIFEDRQRLEARVHRMLHTPIHGQIPPSRTSHLVTNVQVEEPDENGGVAVHASFVVYEVRRDRQRAFAGRYEYRLRSEGAGWRIGLKKVRLLNNDSPIYNLTFML